MGLKQVEPRMEKVGGMKFHITPFPAFKAANITGELVNVLAPLLTSLFPLVGEGGDMFDIDVDKAVTALGNSIGIDGDMIEKLIKKLIIGGHIVVELENDNGEVEAERLDMDIANEIFCGNVQDMFILCYYVIRLNFNGFFEKLTARFGDQKVVSQLTAPVTQRKTI